MPVRSLCPTAGASYVAGRGGTIDSDFVHVITLRSGKWLRFRDFMNTAVAVEAFAGK